MIWIAIESFLSHFSALFTDATHIRTIDQKGAKLLPFTLVYKNILLHFKINLVLLAKFFEEEM